MAAGSLGCLKNHLSFPYFDSFFGLFLLFGLKTCIEPLDWKIKWINFEVKNRLNQILLKNFTSWHFSWTLNMNPIHKIELRINELYFFNFEPPRYSFTDTNQTHFLHKYFTPMLFIRKIRNSFAFKFFHYAYLCAVDGQTNCVP